MAKCSAYSGITKSAGSWVQESKKRKPLQLKPLTGSDSVGSAFIAASREDSDGLKHFPFPFSVCWGVTPAGADGLEFSSPNSEQGFLIRWVRSRTSREPCYFKQKKRGLHKDGAGGGGGGVGLAFRRRSEAISNVFVSPQLWLMEGSVSSPLPICILMIAAQPPTGLHLPAPLPPPLPPPAVLVLRVSVL